MAVSHTQRCSGSSTDWPWTSVRGSKRAESSPTSFRVPAQPPQRAPERGRKAHFSWVSLAGVGAREALNPLIPKGRWFNPANRSWVKSDERGVSALASANPRYFMVAGAGFDQRPLGYEGDLEPHAHQRRQRNQEKCAFPFHGFWGSLGGLGLVLGQEVGEGLCPLRATNGGPRHVRRDPEHR